MAFNVLIVSNLFPPEIVGGAEIVAHRQALALKARGADVAVLAGGLPSSDFPSGSLRLETVDGLPVYRIALRSFEPDANFYWEAAAKRLRALLSARRPDVVHFHNVMGLGANLIPIARRAGVKTVVTLHDHWGFCFKNTRLRNDGRVCQAFEECAACIPTVAVNNGREVPMRLRRDYVSWCLNQADLLLSPSTYLAQAYAEAGLPRPTVLSNGIPCAKISCAAKPPGDVVRFFASGYLGEHKGFPTLLDAAARLAQDRDLVGRWSLTIAGHGHLEPLLSRQIEEDRFGGAVAFVGRLPHAKALETLGQSHVVIVPSAWPENEPVTLLEALASGTAQIASRIGGNIELVLENETGLLFEPHDDQGLASAMRAFITDPGLVDRFGQQSAQRRAGFDEQLTVDKLLGLLEELESRTAPEEDIVVICAGHDWSSDVQLMVHHLHEAEDQRPRIRLIWYEWALQEHWSTASLLWMSWGDGEQDLSIVARALRSGLPVITPRGSATATLGGEKVTTYDNMLEALGWIAALQDVPKSDLAGDPASVARARLLGALAPRSSLYLAAERVG